MPVSWKNRVRHRLRLRISQARKLPKADLKSCLLNVAMRGFVAKRIIDVGANRARWSLVARQVFPNSKIVLIEPQAELEPVLDQFCQNNPGCKYVIAGAGASPGRLALTLNPDTVSSTFILTEKQAQSLGFEQRLVPILTLDEVARREFDEPPDIIKIDAEGLEAEVLRGSRTLLGKSEMVFLEAHLLGEDGCSSGLIDLMALMSDFGYAPYDFTWFGRRPCDQAIMLTEVAFALKNGMLRRRKGWC